MPSIIGDSDSQNSTENNHKTISVSSELNYNDRFVHCKNENEIELKLPIIVKNVTTVTIYADNGPVSIVPKGDDKLELDFTLSDKTLVELISDYESKTWRIN